VREIENRHQKSTSQSEQRVGFSIFDFRQTVRTGLMRPFLMVPRKTKNEKICWALIGSKVFVFRFSEGPNHALHGNTKTKNENQSTVGQCRNAAVQIEQPSINLLFLQIGASFSSAIMSIARGFGY
jgi:hypothetical protein